MQPVDTHCHLDFDHYDEDRDAVIEECGERLAAVVNVGTNPERNEASLALARDHAFVHATMGLHPTEIREVSDDDIDTIAEQIREHADELVAVGEIGLDYHHVQDPDMRQRQREVFERLLAVTAEVDLPVVLHTRDAEPDAMETVKGFDGTVVQHCFNGSPQLAMEAVDRGYYVSVSTQVLYSSRVEAITDAVPLEHMLLETDSPFLYRGERNVPWHVEESTDRIAAIKEVDRGEVVRVTTENAATAFSLDL